MNDNFKPTDFVQVMKIIRLEGGELAETWRNALYIGMADDGHHMVIYTDGTKEVLNDRTKIRKAL